MARGPLYEKEYKHQFSGHETFPLRYGWLKKAYDAVSDTEGDEDNKRVFLGDDAIARFGVGKNMVASMRHWATVAGIVEEPQGSQMIRTTELGRKLFGTSGDVVADPLALGCAANQDDVVLGFQSLPCGRVSARQPLKGAGTSRE
jgi:hypothetical protein